MLKLSTMPKIMNVSCVVIVPSQFIQSIANISVDKLVYPNTPDYMGVVRGGGGKGVVGAE